MHAYYHLSQRDKILVEKNRQLLTRAVGTEYKQSNLQWFYQLPFTYGILNYIHLSQRDKILVKKPQTANYRPVP